jgi:DNA recombination protein RmuC
MGFQTLAIEKRASEVWEVLGAVKTEFGKFGEVLDRVKKQLTTATRTIDLAEVRTRQMERKLRAVEQLPESDSPEVLGLPPVSAQDAEPPVADEEPLTEGEGPPTEHDGPPFGGDGLLTHDE